MEYTARGFPSPIAPYSEKITKEYGLRVARAAYAPFDIANQYVSRRNANYVENDLFFQGQQPLAPYLKLLETDGKNSYINIDFQPIPIVKKFAKIVVNGYMSAEEKCVATAINKLIIERKDRKRTEAEFRMREKDYIAQLQAESGVEFEDPNAFTPDSPEELDVWAEMNDKEREELLMQEALRFNFDNNDFFTIVKERILLDGFKKSLAAVFTYLDDRGEIKTKFIRPEYFLYGPSERNDLVDSNWFGHYELISVAEARVRWGTDEKFLYSIARSVGGVYGNDAFNLEWNNDWRTTAIRPYDDYLCKIMHVWYRGTKDLNYVKGKTGRGRNVFDITADKSNPTNENKKAGTKQVMTAYEGWWYVGTDQMAEWGEAKNQIRRNPNLDKVLSPYTAYMWDNDGSQAPSSKIDNIKGDVKAMDLCRIQIQQIVAKASPDGYFIDIDGLYDVELSKGQGAVSPMRLISIAQQTGNVYYRGSSITGDPSNSRKPIEPNQTQFGNKLEQLINLYNVHLNNIRDFLGVNEIRDGSAVNPKIGLGVIQEQLAASNTATADLYSGYLSIGSRLSEKVGQLLWDSLKYGSEYEGYKRILGEANVAFLQEANYITDSNYDLKLEVKSTAEQKQVLNTYIETSLANQLIEMQDAIFIRSIDDIKLAFRYMVVQSEKRKKDKLKEAESNSKMNAEQQQGSIAAKAQADQQTYQMKAQSEMMVQATKSSTELRANREKFLYDMQLECTKLGIEMPPEYKVELDEIFTKAAEDEQLQGELLESQYGTESEQPGIEQQSTGPNQ